MDFLKEITYSSFFVPPPWIAFDNYPVEWWGAAMQGDAEYYDSNFFYPFFIQLDEDKKINITKNIMQSLIGKKN